MVKVAEINQLASTTFVVLYHGFIILANQKRGDLSYLLVLRDGFIASRIFLFPARTGGALLTAGLSEFLSKRKGQSKRKIKGAI